MARILANIYATRYNFIDKKFAKTIYQVLEIELQYPIKLKQIQKFDSKAAKPMTHAIYPILTVGIYTKSLAFLLITKFRNYSIILGQS